MRLWIPLLLLALAPALSFARLDSHIRDSSVTNVPDNYASVDSLFLTDIRDRALGITNNSATDIFVCMNARTAATCSDDLYLPANSGLVFDKISLGQNIWVRGASTISSGFIAVYVWSD